MACAKTNSYSRRRCGMALVLISLSAGIGWAAPPEPDSESVDFRPPKTTTLLQSEAAPIDLDTCLRLARARNPELMLARERVVEAAALRQLAAAQILPNLNGGTNYDNHHGNLQQSSGNILSVRR